MRVSTENRNNGNKIKIKEYSQHIYYILLKRIYTDSVDIETKKAIINLYLFLNFNPFNSYFIISYFFY